jgi:hypothetical protein
MRIILITLLFINISFSHPVLDIINNPYSVPYFLNLTAMGLLLSDPEKVKNYIRWYLDHFNYPDKYG